jgi:hypothetical protein
MPKGKMPKIDSKMVQLIRSALTAIDGLWFLEVEKKHGFEDAFEVDIDVWKRYGPIMVNRIKKALEIKDNTLESFLRIFELLSEIDGTRFKLMKKTAIEAILGIEFCPWWENLKRSKRETLVRCDTVDREIYPEWIKAFNPAYELLLTKSLPEGHDMCELVIKQKSL